MQRLLDFHPTPLLGVVQCISGTAGLNATTTDRDTTLDAVPNNVLSGICILQIGLSKVGMNNYTLLKVCKGLSDLSRWLRIDIVTYGSDWRGVCDVHVRRRTIGVLTRYPGLPGLLALPLRLCSVGISPKTQIQ
jgi:hypothetical protein